MDFLGERAPRLVGRGCGRGAGEPARAPRGPRGWPRPRHAGLLFPPRVSTGSVRPFPVAHQKDMSLRPQPGDPRVSGVRDKQALPVKGLPTPGPACSSPHLSPSVPHAGSPRPPPPFAPRSHYHYFLLQRDSGLDFVLLLVFAFFVLFCCCFIVERNQILHPSTDRKGSLLINGTRCLQPPHPRLGSRAQWICLLTSGPSNTEP